MSHLTVIAGPTAVGKGTVVRYMLDHFENIHLSISATPRAKRPDEIDGVHYYFMTHEQFDDLVAADQMLEYATVHGENKYGTPRKPVEDALSLGKFVLLEIDLQGARQVKAAMPAADLVFIAPPSWEELVQRLRGRGTENAEEQSRRLETARVELASQDEFDHVVINDDVARCAHEVLDLMQA